jgi:hypothetical protein
VPGPEINADSLHEVLYGLVDALASVEHRRWAHWQEYMHGKAVRQPDGALLFPAEIVARWERQARTNYADLTEPEKESDREQVRKYLPLIAAAVAAELNKRA